jgi:hypothetical protein
VAGDPMMEANCFFGAERFSDQHSFFGNDHFRGYGFVAFHQATVFCGLNALPIPMRVGI